MLMRRDVIFLIIGLMPTWMHAQSKLEVGELRTDLIEHTSKVWQNGHLTGLSLEEYLHDTSNLQVVNIVSRFPNFSWVLTDDRKNVYQKTYRIIVASSLGNIEKNSGNVWDSKVIVSSRSSAVPYKGMALKPKTIYYWKVIVGSNKNDKITYSKHVSFITGGQMFDYATPSYPLQKTVQFPISIKQHSHTSFLVDFGKDAFGQLKLRLKSDSCCDSITVEMGEALKGGLINSKPGGTVRYAKYKIGLKSGTHIYSVRFNPNKRNTGGAAIKMPLYIGEALPFRYVMISNYAKPVSDSDIIREMVHYPFDESDSQFTSSDSVLNQVWDICKYTMKATSFAGIFVDGDRERIPYEADALLNQLSFYAADNEYSLARLTHEYLLKHPTWPTEWILQSVLLAWNDYLYTADVRSIKSNYTTLKAKLITGLSGEDGLISSRTGKQTKTLLESIHFRGRELRDIVDWPTTETDGFVFSDINSVVNAYHYRALILMSKMALAVNNKKDANLFSDQARLVKKSFQKKLINPATGLVIDGEGTTHSSLHANMFALAFELVPEENRSKVFDFVRSRGMACSVYGAQFLMEALFQAPTGDYALSLLTANTSRSWYNMIHEGATMTMEAWGNQFKPNQDWNHAWGAVPANIIMRKLVGIESTKAGFEEMSVKPQIGGLSFVSAKVPTIKGTVFVEIKNDLRSYRMKIHIPVNTRARVFLPIEYAGKMVSINGRAIKATALRNGCFIGNIGSGDYNIEAIKSSRNLN